MVFFGGSFFSGLEDSPVVFGSLGLGLLALTGCAAFARTPWARAVGAMGLVSAGLQDIVVWECTVQGFATIALAVGLVAVSGRPDETDWTRSDVHAWLRWSLGMVIFAGALVLVTSGILDPTHRRDGPSPDILEMLRSLWERFWPGA